MAECGWQGEVRVEEELPLVLDAVELVGQVGIEGDRIEPLGDVPPARHAGRSRQLLSGRDAGPGAEDVLHLLQAERRADGHEQPDVAFGLLQLPQHLVGDHRALAVRDDDERAAARRQALRPGCRSSPCGAPRGRRNR